MKSTAGVGLGGKRPGVGRARKSGDLRILEGKTIPMPKTRSGNVRKPTMKSEKAVGKFNTWLTADESNEISKDTVSVIGNTLDYLAAKGLDVRPDDPIVLGYAINFARWKQCQMKMNELGLLNDDGTENMYSKVSREFGKMYINYWYAIQQFIQTDGRQSEGEQSDDMEALLG